MSTSESKTIATIRSDVCNTVLTWLLLPTISGAIFSLIQPLEAGWFTGYRIPAVMCITLTLVSIFRHRLPYVVRAGSIVALSFLVGASRVIAFGSPFGLTYLVFAGVMATVFFGEKAGLWSIFANVVMIGAVFAGVSLELLPSPPPIEMNWVIWSVSMIVAAGNSFGPILAISRFMRHLDVERRRAEAANEAKSNFLAMMSHELRTPLTGILGITELLKSDKLTPEQSDRLSRISTSGQVLLHLLNDLLDFSKIEANRLAIEPVPFSLRAVIADVRELLTPLAREKSLALHVDTSSAPADSFIGDPARIRQVLHNLVGNAIKFTERGSVILRLSQEPLDTDRIAFTAEVIDTGIGIPAQMQARLFEPFTQGAQGTAQRQGGTGLGLAISQRLVEAMGGKINLKSSPGEGSTFSFRIPLRIYAQQAFVTDESAANSSQTHPTRSLRVLVAEDDETVRYLLEAMLRRWGHRVRAVANGAAALEEARTDRYDIVLMDIQMPVMDGMQATQRIRALPTSAAQIPIIALTANILPEQRAAYLDAGIDAVLAKPINWLELANALDPSAARARHADTAPVAARPKRSTADVLDEEAIAPLREAFGDEKIRAMLGDLRKGLRNYRDQLRTSIATDDYTTASRALHTLKGMCLQFGASTAGAMAAELEAQSESIADIARGAEPLIAVLDELDAALAERDVTVA